MVEVYRESDEHPEIVALREADREYHRLVIKPEIDAMVQRHEDELFYKDARPFISRDNSAFSVQRSRVLANHYPKFNFFGKQPLVNRDGNPIREDWYIGHIFNQVVKGVEKRLTQKN